MNTTDLKPAAAELQGPPDTCALGYKQELRRSLTLIDLLAYGLVYIAPIAPVALFGIVFNASHGMAPLAYLLGFVAMTFTALSYMSMAQAFPVAGSVYTYASRSLGPTIGFLGGWAILLDYLLFPAICYVSCAIAVNSALPGISRPVCVVLTLALTTIINFRGIETTARASFVLLVFQLVLIVLFIAVASHAVWHHTDGARLSLRPFYNPGELTPTVLFGAISLAVFSYLGFDAISTLAEESQTGARGIARATLLSLLIVAGLFVAQTWLASLFFLERSSLPAGRATDAAFYDLAAFVGGYWFKFLLAVPGVFLSGMACAVTGQAATARVLYGMARDGRLPAFMARVDPRRQVPQRAMFVVAALTLIIALLLVDRLELLTSMISFGALCGFLLVHASVIAHFHGREGGPLRWWRHRLSPALGFLIILYVLWNAQVSAKIIGVSWMLVGTMILLLVRSQLRSATGPGNKCASQTGG